MVSVNITYENGGERMLWGTKQKKYRKKYRGCIKLEPY